MIPYHSAIMKAIITGLNLAGVHAISDESYPRAMGATASVWASSTRVPTGPAPSAYRYISVSYCCCYCCYYSVGQHAWARRLSSRRGTDFWRGVLRRHPAIRSRTYPRCPALYSYSADDALYFYCYGSGCDSDPVCSMVTPYYHCLASRI